MRRRDRMRSSDVVGVLDIGTSKVCCLIVAPDAPAQARVVGIGHQRSRGIKAGVVIDLSAAEEGVRTAVSQAERAAGVRLDEVVISVSCGRQRSSHFSAHAEVATGIVGDADIERLNAAARQYAERDGRSLIAMNRLGYRLDGAFGGSDPRGMAAGRVTADLHAVTADEPPLRNLMALVERCYLATAGLVPTAYASALAVTSEEERQLGVTCIDIGGGATAISVFSEGKLLLVDSLPVGGNHVTFDIARALTAPLAEAERIKTLYGTLIGARSDEHEVFSYSLAGEDEPAMHQATKAQLRCIVEPRIDGLLALVHERLERSGMGRHADERVVLTGGTSQLMGLGEYAADVVRRPVRVARPVPAAGLPASLCSASFATVLGLLQAVQEPGDGVLAYREGEAHGTTYWGRMGQWIRESF